MSGLRDTIQRVFSETLEERCDKAFPGDDDFVLLESGLDSLGFAILVVKLEDELGYDPFTIMKKPVYPVTFSEFLRIYEENRPD